MRAFATLGFLAVLLSASPQKPPRIKASSESLGGAERYLTFISTDKPVYRPGERVYARGVLLEAKTRVPRTDAEMGHVEIRGPKGDVVTAGNVSTADSVWGFSWDIPGDQAGGEYILKVTYPYSGHAPAERKLDVRSYRAPRLKSQIVFLRDGYGPGDTVTATLEVKRAEGGLPSGATVTATAQVDGAEVARVTSKVDAKGLCTVAFPLPKSIDRGDGTLAFNIEDGGVVETAAKTIPILLQTVDLALYPEGGDLVAGLPTRIYFEARTPSQKPADVLGVVIDEGSGAQVTRFRSEHEGRGAFEITPVRGRKYALHITEPSGIKKVYPLPTAKRAGAQIRALTEVTPKGESVKLSVALRGVTRAKVTLSKKETEVAAAELLQTGTVELDPGHADGVLIATVWDSKGIPLAERLVFREPAKSISVQLRADKKSYVPGDAVKLTVRTTEGGKPVSAVVGFAVTDDSVLELIEKREQAAPLPVQVLLEPEVRELADARVYFDRKNPKAKRALDLLLGTQGWRRFAFIEADAFASRSGDPAVRVLAKRVQPAFNQGNFAGDVRHFRGGVVAGVIGAAPRNLEQVMVEGEAPVAFAPPPARLPAAPPLAAKKDAGLGGPAARRDFLQRDQDRKAVAANHGVAAKLRWEAEPFIVVREYAHSVRPDRKPTDRVDFTETLYWNAAIRTDAKSGEATVRFALNDSVTSFKASAGAFGSDGALGASTTTLKSVQPFYVEPKLPLEVTSGDVIDVPVALVNGTSEELKAAVAISSTGALQIGSFSPLSLKALERARRIVELKVGQDKKPIDLVFAAKAGDFADTVTRPLSIKPNGFPIEVAFGGMIGPGAHAAHSFTLPRDVVPASMTANVALYPTPLANMTQALARLIQEPYGCFEQTSSTSYPLTMAQQYFLSHTGVDPKIVLASQEKLEAGYKRLVGFETSDRGYEWFGQSPGHEALTAFGLLHFNDMKQVRPVDEAMLERTRAWLLKQRDGKGGFERKRRALHTWVEDRDSSNAYILWALLESGERDVRPEVAALKEYSAKSQNSYVVALAANSLWLAGEKSEAKKLMDRLAAKQRPDGTVDGATGSIVGSGGEALAIETTSLATLAWLRDPAFARNVERSIKYLASSCDEGRYGSTQSTVLALRAIVAYDKARAKPKASGTIRMYLNGQPVGTAVAFDKSTEGAIQLPDISDRLSSGEQKVELKMEGGSEMPYSIAIHYNALTPVSSKSAALGLDVNIAKSSLSEGDLDEAQVVVTNRTNEQLPAAVAIVGLPGGLEPRHDQLKELVKKGSIVAYEVRGREVVLYWRGMEPGKRMEIPLALTASVPGTYTGPASRAYLYYTDEHKTWVKGLKVTIAPKS